mmetsp:Transcript_127608/g.397428  ORF Transcript_127608/g.397428 Transcript_127608/m.397428 type:complete len:339 (-) Transcript_127608:478-1494(-)
MEAGQRDELPAESHLRQVPDEGLHLGVRHARRVPVEGRAEVVGEHLVRHCRAHRRGELRGLAQDGLPGLHPDAVRVGREGDGALDAVLRGALDAVVALDGARDVPVEEDVSRAEGCRRLSHLRERHLQGVLQPLAGVDALGLQDLGHGVGEGHATGAVLPVLVRPLADRLEEGLHARDGGALDVRVVDRVDVGVDHGGGLGVGARDQDQGGVQDVGLEAASDEPLDVLPSGDQDLAAHVAALLGPGLLVLNVDAGRTVLNEHLGELHRGGEPTVAGVGVRNDGIEVVHNRCLCTLVRAHAAALLILLPVVEELCPEKLIHLVGDRVVRVVRHVGSGLV